MPILLNFVYVMLLLVCSPYLAIRAWKTGRYREGWVEKFLGRAPVRVGSGPCIWFHAVSVGEVLLLRPLIAEFARRRPGWEIVISATTSTGLKVARETYPDLITFYAPFDFSWATHGAVSRIKPTILALVELEVWPNLVRAVKQVGGRVAIVNGRLSLRSHKGYHKLRGPLRKTFRRIDSVAVQTDEYADRFADLGVPREKIAVTGSVKFDGLEGNRANTKTQELRKALGLGSSDIVFVAGSTMEGEEAAALQAYRAARASHPGLRLVIVPRHAERFNQVAEMLVAAGERVVRRSEKNAAALRGEPPAVILVDSLGELGAVWGLADIAFVGGSLFAGRGGQNMMEPAAFGASVMFGPYTSNFRATVEQLLFRDGARRVEDAEGMTQGLLEDLEDPEAAATRGATARTFVLAQNGASARTFAELDRLVETRQLDRVG
jgi:3-deoxy-D-manno-octulosonic-acid transferase